MAAEQTTKRSGNFLVQGSILAAAGIIVRIIGLAYRIPLIRIIGEEGSGYYSAAYNVYAIMLLLSSYSLPLAVSKMISARIAKNGYISASRIFKSSLVYATIVGAAGCMITYFGAGWFAETFFHMPFVKYALMSLAPTIWIMAYLGVFRGYYQGHSTMVPTAVSQIFEQVINALVSVGAAYYLCELAKRNMAGQSEIRAYGAAGGTIGTGAGAAFALLILLVLFISAHGKRRELIKSDCSEYTESYPEITRILFLTVVPVIASTAIYNINSIIDGALFGTGMDLLGALPEKAAADYGVYTGKYLILINVPVAIANSMASSLIPVLSRAAAARERGSVNQGISTAIRFAMLIGIPASVGLAVLAFPVMDMLFGRSVLAARLLVFGSPAVMLYSLSTISNAVLQGTNHMKCPVKNAFISLIIHIIALLPMLFIFRLGVYSLVFANLVFALSMCILNAIDIRRHLSYRQEILKTYLGPAFCSALMGAAAYLIYRSLLRITEDSLILTAAPFIAAVIIYPVLLIKTGCINEEELIQMPKGRKLAGIAKRFGLL